MLKYKLRKYFYLSLRILKTYQSVSKNSPLSFHKSIHIYYLIKQRKIQEFLRKNYKKCQWVVNGDGDF